MVKIAVIGAGVNGTSSAVLLQETIPGCKVSLVSEKFSPDTTGDGSSGIWFPHKLSDTPEHLVERWGQSTFDHIMALIVGPEAAKAGVHTVSSYILQGQPITKDPLYSKIVMGYRHMTAKELKMFEHLGDSAKYGCFFTAVKVDVKVYLPWLMKRFVSGGGKVIQKKISSLEEVFTIDDFDVVVNCSGLGAYYIVGDKTMTPIRGQTIRVSAPWIKHWVFCGDFNVLPGIHDVVLGVTAQEGNWNTNVSPFDKKAIWEGCCKLVPSLKDSKFITDWVGLRPGRPSVRLEVDQIRNKHNKIVKVIHNYGHGGAGVTLHWGCAQDVVKLVQQELHQPKSRL